MGLVNHQILKSAVRFRAVVQRIHEPVASQALRCDVQQHDAMIEHPLEDIIHFVTRSVGGQIIRRITKTSRTQPLHLITHECAQG